MGLYLRKKLDQGGEISVWEVTESEEELLKIISIPSDELEELYFTRSESRRREKLAVRALLNTIFEDKVYLGHHDNGAPFIQNDLTHISITHTNRFVAIITHPTEEGGIDIESIERDFSAVEKKALSEDEKDDLQEKNRNLQLAIDTVTNLVKKYPSDSETIAQALLVQGEALIALARFDEAVLVLERVGLSGKAGAADRASAQILRADALYAMGADNPARYPAALEAYRAVRFTVTDHSLRLVLSFKIARTLEKLKQMDEAIDCYYSEVIVAYCNGRNRGIRYGDDARAAFSRAAFKVADEYEERGLDVRAMRVLELVVESGLPAAEEAQRRINRYNKKGFL